LAARPDAYDCVFLSDVSVDPEQARVLAENALSVLKPGGVLVWIFPCLQPFVGGTDARIDWRYTESAVRLILSRCFPLDCFEIEAFGNVKVCAAALHGLGAEQLDPAALNTTDPSFPFVICARAIKRLPHGDAPVARIGRSAGTQPEARGAVLMYHKIATLPSDERHLAVIPAHFRAHMTHLRRHYHPMSLEDMARATREGTLPDKALAVTFDDGYLDALKTASPILTEFDIPATFFLNTLDLDHENEFWGDTLERIFLEEPVVPKVLDLDLLGSRVRIPAGTAEERRTAWKIVSQRFYPLPADSRVLLLRLVVEWSGLELRPRETHRRMVRHEIVTLAARSGHTIGAHTTHHLWLTEHSAQIQRQEITQNKTDLEQLLCRPVLTFAYPYGVHDASTVEIARAAPFLCAVTVEPGLIHSGIDLLKVRRLEVPPGDLAPFSAFLERAFTAAVEDKDVSGV
jgi:peptidoglycan/xylan/chitin deacetylase (PgdA/CDA1 family)